MDLDEEIEIRNCVVEVLLAMKYDHSRDCLKRARESITEAIRILKENA